MSEQPLGGMNAWGGRRADGGSPVAAVPEDQPDVRAPRLLHVNPRELASLIAVLTAGPMIVAGAGLLAGAGGALIALGAYVLILGVLLGFAA